MSAEDGGSAAEHLVQPADGVPTHALHEVRVGVHRLRDGRMPEQTLDHLRVLPLVAQPRGERVTQAVKGEALAFEPGFLQERLVLAVVEVAWVYRPAHLVGEHEAGVLPRRCCEYFGALTCLVRPQGCRGGLIEGHVPAAGLVLRGSETQAVLGNLEG